jgi:hypothetical protein
MGDFSFAAYWRFILDLELYKENIIASFNEKNIGQGGYLILDGINEKF